MPPAASRSHRDSRQHFHSGRQGGMLVPHGPISGLLFSVNPRQEGHALREAREYCANLTEDLQRVCAAEMDMAGEAVVTKDPSTPMESDEAANACTSHSVGQTTSTSNLLAAELAAYVTRPSLASSATCAPPHDRKRGRERASTDDDSTNHEGKTTSDEDGERSPRAQRDVRRSSKRQQWFAPLETNCKGYLLLNIPVVKPAQTCVMCHAGAAGSGRTAVADTEAQREREKGEGEGEGEGEVKESTAPGGLPPHTIVINPLVSIVVERVFRDLAALPRPVFKNCFRLFPVELTCCPTIAEMQKAVQTLLHARFPRPEDHPAAPSEAAVAAHTPLSFAQTLPFYEPEAAVNTDSGASLVKSMYKIILQFSIKNNTNVEKKKAEVLSALQAAIPANRFIVLRGSSVSGKNKIKADASLVVSVLHATCAMGVQMHYEDRGEFNVHAMGEKALDLSNTVLAPS